MQNHLNSVFLVGKFLWFSDVGQNLLSSVFIDTEFFMVLNHDADTAGFCTEMQNYVMSLQVLQNRK